MILFAKHFESFQEKNLMTKSSIGHLLADMFKSSPFEETDFDGKEKYRNSFIAWLENPQLLQNALEAKAAVRLCRRRIESHHHLQGEKGVVASLGIFEWSLQTGALCKQLTRRALATLIESLSDNVTPQNAKFAWGFAPEQEFVDFLDKAKTNAMVNDAIVNTHKGQCSLAEFDAIIDGLPLRQDTHSKNAVAALRMSIDGKLGKMKIAELLTGKHSADVCNKLVRKGQREVFQASMLKVANELEVPDLFLSALHFLSIEEIDGPLDKLSFQVCDLAHKGAMDEVFAEMIIRLAVEAPQTLHLFARRAECPLSIERPMLSRQKASDYLPEQLGFFINLTLATNWLLHEKMPPDVKLVMLCLAASGETGKELRIATGLSFMRWQIACKRIEEKNYLAQLESVACNKKQNLPG